MKFYEVYLSCDILNPAFQKNLSKEELNAVANNSEEFSRFLRGSFLRNMTDDLRRLRHVRHGERIEIYHEVMTNPPEYVELEILIQGLIYLAL